MSKKNEKYYLIKMKNIFNGTKIIDIVTAKNPIIAVEKERELIADKTNFDENNIKLIDIKCIK